MNSVKDIISVLFLMYGTDEFTLDDYQMLFTKCSYYYSFFDMRENGYITLVRPHMHDMYYRLTSYAIECL